MKPQVEKLIVGNAVPAQTTLPTFITTSADKTIQVVDAKGGAIALGKDFKLVQKHGDEVITSDLIKADKVSLVKVVPYKPEVLKVVTVNGFAVTANTTYIVEVRIYNDAGALSVENFAVVSGYYVTGANVTGVTVPDIIDGLVLSLNSNFKLRGDNEVVITSTATEIIITGKAQKVVPGRNEGRQIEFDVLPKQYDNTTLNNTNLGTLVATVNTLNNPGSGTGKYAVNLEWFTQGYDNDVYRERAYPANFDTPYFTTIDGVYNVIHIFYYDGRDYTSVEKQHKLLTILVDKGTDTAPLNGETNKILTRLTTILGSGRVPATLPIT